MHVNQAPLSILLGLMLCAPAVHAGNTKTGRTLKPTFFNLRKQPTGAAPQKTLTLYNGTRKSGTRTRVGRVPADTSFMVFGPAGRASPQSWTTPGTGRGVGAMLFSMSPKKNVARVGLLSKGPWRIQWGTLLDTKGLARKKAVRELIKRSGLEQASISFKKVEMGTRFSKILDKPRPTLKVVVDISGTKNGRSVTKTFRGEAEVRGNFTKGIAGISVGAFTDQQPH